MFFPPTSKRLSVARTDDVSSSSMSSSSYTSRGNNNDHRGGGGHPGDHGDPNDPNNNNNAPVVTYAKEIIADHSCCSSISSISMETKGPRDFDTTHS